VVLDNLDTLSRYWERVLAQAVTSQAMPLGNASGMTLTERGELGQWLQAQKP
jgi:uncharacterized membrane protein